VFISFHTKDMTIDFPFFY